MGELLNSGQISDIKDVIKKVTDQFFVTPVIISVAIDSLDRFNEDRLDVKFEHFVLNCMYEFPTVRSQVQDTQQGYTQFYDVKATLNYRDIKSAGLADGNNETKINITRDYMKINNRKYKIISVSLDGPIEAENVLVVIYGKLEENKT